MNKTSVGKWVIDPDNLPAANERTQDQTDTTLLTCLWGFDEEALDEWWELHSGAVAQVHKARTVSGNLECD